MPKSSTTDNTGPTVSRRGLSLALVGGAFGAATQAGATATTSTPSPAGFRPPQTAAETVRQFLRFFAATRGEVAMACEGIIYGQTPNEVARRLIGWRSVTKIKVIEYAPNRFRTEQREAMHLVDLESGEPATTLVSPYTGETVIPVGYATPHNVYFFEESGVYQRAWDDPAQRREELRPMPDADGFPKERPPINRTLDWRVDNTDVGVTESRFNRYPSAISETEFPRSYAGPERLSVDVLSYSAPYADYVNPAIDALPVRFAIMSDAPWPLWLLRGRAPGRALWNAFGRKYRSFDELPPHLIAATERVYPGFLDDPWKFPEYEFGTAAQLRRLKAAGKL